MSQNISKYPSVSCLTLQSLSTKEINMNFRAQMPKSSFRMFFYAAGVTYFSWILKEWEQLLRDIVLPKNGPNAKTDVVGKFTNMGQTRNSRLSMAEGESKKWSQTSMSTSIFNDPKKWSQKAIRF